MCGVIASPAHENKPGQSNLLSSFKLQQGQRAGELGASFRQVSDFLRRLSSIPATLL
jgi:hypothetical protein